ncbi:tetratricopeptide repeat protein [Massilia arenae]|uniref:TonB family protein n=1 Tax=Massilia arenae TaxID=2603288 RepID=A0A5C7G4U1_9BURK|nr:tetratricopeptide repeat protein [Massilia arenae]TXG00955.1 TonB family protein [Massilia arenae]
MSVAILFLAAAAAVASVHDSAEQDRIRQAMKFDLYACARPAYPPAALAQRAGGQSTLEIQVGAGGKVADARVAVSSGRADLDAAALASIRTCSFHAVNTLGKPPGKRFAAQFIWKPGEPPRALDPALVMRTQRLAELGDPVAQNTLGTWYEQGRSFEKDLAQAAALYRLAAHGGNAYAQNNLGVLLNRGAGVARDRRQAVFWYAKAAEQGHGWGQANLSWAYQHGSVGEPDMEQARKWLTRSAEGGLAAAQVRLGLLMLDRAAYAEARAPGAQWFARAAVADDPAGLYYLGRSYELGVGNEPDDVLAAALYRRALGRSGGRAETALATLIEDGRAQAEAPDEVLTLYETAMRSRDGGAFYRYGLVLERRGDHALAAALFRHGRTLGDCRAAVRSIQIQAGWTPEARGASPRAVRPVSVKRCGDRLEPLRPSWRELY